MSQLDAFLNLYPKLGPLNSKCIPFNCRKSKMEHQLHQQRSPSLNTQSLMSKYSEICNKRTNKETSPRSRPMQRTKHSLSALKDYDCSLGTLDNNKSRDQQKVVNAINSMHDYTEELKTTLVSEYKHKKNRVIRKSQKFLEEFSSQKSLWRKQQEDNPESISIKNPLLSNYSSKGIGLKTINILYRAIIDQSLHPRRKEDFELQANKLPIIDRFNTKRRTKFRDSQTLIEKIGVGALEQRRTMAAYHVPKQRQKHWGKQVEMNTIRQDVDIIPWSTEEERIE